MNTLAAVRSHTPKGRAARDRVLAAAERLFAARGFHGASLRDVADAARLPLATIVYHFAKKEQLYGAVLTAIADELTAAIADGIGPGGPARSAAVPSYVASGAWVARLDAMALALVRWSAARPGRVRLLLRELLDNPSRVARASRLPLASVLEQMSALVAEAAQAGVLAPGTPEIAVLHVVGAVSYVVAARPTVDRIVGAARARRMTASYEREALLFARRALGLSRELHAAATPSTPSSAREKQHAARNPDAPREADPRARRGANHRSRGGAVDAPDRGVRRRRAPRS